MSGEKKMDTSFTGMLGECPRIKIWEFLLISRGNFEYSIRDIANGANISRPTCYNELGFLKEQKIIIKGGKYKGKQLYRLNTTSPNVKVMLKAFHTFLNI